MGAEWRPGQAQRKLRGSSDARSASRTALTNLARRESAGPVLLMACLSVPMVHIGHANVDGDSGHS